MCCNSKNFAGIKFTVNGEQVSSFYNFVDGSVTVKNYNADGSVNTDAIADFVVITQQKSKSFVAGTYTLEQIKTGFALAVGEKIYSIEIVALDNEITINPGAVALSPFNTLLRSGNHNSDRTFYREVSDLTITCVGPVNLHIVTF